MNDGQDPEQRPDGEAEERRSQGAGAEVPGSERGSGQRQEARGPSVLELNTFMTFKVNTEISIIET